MSVLGELMDGPATPSQLASTLDINIAHVSRALGQLRDREMVDLLVSEDQRKGRVYGITEKGETVWKRIEAEGMA